MKCGNHLVAPGLLGGPPGGRTVALHGVHGHGHLDVQLQGPPLAAGAGLHTTVDDGHRPGLGLGNFVLTFHQGEDHLHRTLGEDLPLPEFIVHGNRVFRGLPYGTDLPVGKGGMTDSQAREMMVLLGLLRGQILTLGTVVFPINHPAFPLNTRGVNRSSKAFLIIRNSGA